MSNAIRNRISALEKTSLSRNGPLRFFRVQGGSPSSDPEAFVRSLGYEVGDDTRVLWRPLFARGAEGPVMVESPFRLIGKPA